MTELQRGFTYFGLSSLIASSDHPSCLMIHDYRLIWAIRIHKKERPTPTNPRSDKSSSSILLRFPPQQGWFCILLPHQSHYSSPYVVPALSEQANFVRVELDQTLWIIGHLHHFCNAGGLIARNSLRGSTHPSYSHQLHIDPKAQQLQAL